MNLVFIKENIDYGGIKNYNHSKLNFLFLKSCLFL